MAQDSAFQGFVNRELPKRISSEIPEKGNLKPGLVPHSTGVGLAVEFIDEDKTFAKQKSIITTNTLAVRKGLARWYPTTNISIGNLRAYCGTASEGLDIIAALNVDGAEVARVTIPFGQNYVEMNNLNIRVLKPSYLTLDIVQVGSVHAGTDLTVELFHKVID
ncbi:TPA: hypothetical protein G8N92_005052 [Salmonella enterica]|nr:hypothetical protein [Salmonella enterica]